VRRTPEERKAALLAKLQEQEKKLEVARERKKKIEQRIKQIDEPPVNRKQDARKKILFGVTVMEMMEKDPELHKKIMTQLDLVTKRESDRKLLGLTPLEK
jgi:hypothetical protein